MEQVTDDDLSSGCRNVWDSPVVRALTSNEFSSRAPNIRNPRATFLSVVTDF